MAAQAPDPKGTLEQALAHTERLMLRAPALAVEQADEILRAVPGHPAALLLRAAALRRTGDALGARSALAALAAARPGWAAALTELGQAHAMLGEEEAAIGALRRATAADPDHGPAWLALADALRARGDVDEAGTAYARHVAASVREPELMRAASALADNDLPTAERLLRAYLKRTPTGVAAIRMLAELAGRIGRHRDAETLLRRAIELAPDFTPARHNLALLLHRHGRSEDALETVQALLGEEPDNPTYRILRAAILGRLGRYEDAAAAYRDILKEHPRQAKVWMSLGHILKTLGQEQDSIAAYRHSLTLQPDLGGSWWSLANLKTFRFEPDDVDTMEGVLSRADLAEEERLNIAFALGKAAEDERNYASAFAHYTEGNRIRRTMIPYDPEEIQRIVERQRTLVTPAFMAERTGWGFPAADPIFVVSLPRSGSTLIEQILASHSAVEGTMELPDIGMLASRLGKDGLAGLTEADARAFGEEYLARTRIQRKTGRLHFVDKMPNNWLFVPFIRIILPRAVIIDARRHPLGCGFSLFKQHFARGQAFSYDLTDIGRYYRDYVHAMAHVDQVLPGCVHRVFYERMVEDTETEIRALLAHTGLPFEAACLRFHETERAVHTASAQQVRRPIFREGIEQWQNFEPWLGPLKRALGTVLDSYPDVPAE